MPLLKDTNTKFEDKDGLTACAHLCLTRTHTHTSVRGAQWLCVCATPNALWPAHHILQVYLDMHPLCCCHDDAHVLVMESKLCFFREADNGRKHTRLHTRRHWL